MPNNKPIICPSCGRTDIEKGTKIYNFDEKGEIWNTIWTDSECQKKELAFGDLFFVESEAISARDAVKELLKTLKK